GFSVYIYLPIRSMQSPMMDWGHPQNLSNFYDVLAREGYGTGSLLRPMERFVSQLKGIDLFKEFSILGAMIGLIGIYGSWIRDRRLASAMLLAFFCFSFLIVIVAGNFKGEVEVFSPFYLPAHLIYSIFIGLGTFFMVNIFNGKAETRYSFLSPFVKGAAKLKVAHLLVPFIVMMTLTSIFLKELPAFRACDDFLAFDYGGNEVKSFDENAVYLTKVGSKAFSLWYFQMVERLREDVKVYPVGFLFQGWYAREAMAAVGSSLHSSNYGIRSKKKAMVEAIIVENRNKRPVYSGFFDEEYIPEDMGISNNGITFRLYKNEETETRDVWQYYTLRSLKRITEKMDYQSMGILEDYASSYYNLGLDLYSGGEIESAVHKFEDALHIKPDDADALNNLAIIYADRNVNLMKALSMATQAIQLYDNESKKMNARDTLGWVYYKMGRYENALNELNKATVILKDSSSFHYHLGRTLYMLGLMEDAKKELMLSLDGLSYERREEVLEILLQIDDKGNAGSANL
ncbi:MAG: tetratricopeptide repeat protein, partial [Thermodesulfovibrionia bacterium]|nr:tetratricopeptide repeat protein [Thermodesulfovibrionia bacterium]